MTKPLEQAAEKLGLAKRDFAKILAPEKVHQFKIHVGRKSFPAWRIQHNSARGPYKGGLRYHPAVTRAEILQLAELMTWKTALLNLPYGGSKGGVKFDPKKETPGNIEEITRAYVRRLAKYLGPTKDIPAPDVNTDSQTMAWIVDEYSKILDRFTPAVVTGKPLDLGGAEGRTEATGFGGFWVLEETLKFYPDKLPQKPTLVIQGTGNVGLYFGLAAAKAGLKILAVSDSSGGVFDTDGLPFSKIFQFKQKGGSLAQSSFGVHLTNEKLLTLPVDVLVPAALEDQINEKNARKIKAKVILELANHPTTETADKILETRGIPVIPDILANAGGVTVSYFEWKQNLLKERWSKERVLGLLKRRIQATTAEVLRTAQKEKLTLRTAAFLIALSRVVSAEKKRGRI